MQLYTDCTEEYTYKCPTTGHDFMFNVTIKPDYDMVIQDIDDEMVTIINYMSRSAGSYYDRPEVGDHELIDTLLEESVIDEEDHMLMSAGLFEPVPKSIVIARGEEDSAFVILPHLADEMIHKGWHSEDTPREEIYASIRRYFEYVTDWEDNQWCFVYLHVEMLDNDGIPMGIEDGVGGFESTMFEKGHDNERDGEYELRDLCSVCVSEYLKRGNYQQQLLPLRLSA